MNYKLQLIFISLVIIALMGLMIYCWVELFRVNIHLGIFGILIAVIPFGYMYLKPKFKVVRRE